MKLKFVVRGVLIGVPATCLLFLIGLMILLPQTPLGSPPAPTPLPPTIAAPRGEMPSGPVGLGEYAQYRGSNSRYMVVRPDLSFCESLKSGEPW